MKIGIYSVSSQSGRAFMVDMISKGFQVYGYARESEHGKKFVDIVNYQKGIYLERPKNKNNEKSRYVPLGKNSVGHNIHKLVAESDIIIIAHPSHYLIQTIKALKLAGISKRKIPIILSPARTFATPYLWGILGRGYPFVCLSTSPYSCKAPSLGSSYIKRRKRNWLVSLEGEFTIYEINLLENLFPQAIFNTIPATTSLGNIGAIFHSAYLLNYDVIKDAERSGRDFSFYMEGIAEKSEVAKQLESVDQIRLQIGQYLGLEVYGLKGNPNEKKWQTLMHSLREKEKNSLTDIEKLRKIRKESLMEVSEAITSAQHWLDYTYGVERIPGESLQNAITRTPTYQKMSVPQKRYVEEDVPTGLIPILSIAQRFGIDISPIKTIIDIYHRYYTKNLKNDWRDLQGFSKEFIHRYLKGEFFKVIEKSKSSIDK